jgi:hypothetical protein
MDLSGYKKAYKQACTDLEKLVEQREEIDRKISQVKQAIIGLAPLADESSAGYLLVPEFTDIGITDAIREILRRAGRPMNPIEVRDRLIQMKPSTKEQLNLMASIHTVLKRLVPKEASSSVSKNGDTMYQWKVAAKYSGVVELLRNMKAREVAQANQLAEALKNADMVPGAVLKKK